MRVLLTGASGFVGSHVLDALLANDAEVLAVARHGGAARDGVTWLESDLLDDGAAEEVVASAQATHLMHLAWCATPGEFWTAAENEQWIGATLGLLRAFSAAGGRRAVLVGSCAEYEWGPHSLRESETRCRPATLYGACKLATLLVGSAAAAQLGVSLAWPRIFFLYGPGEHPQKLVAQIARSCLAGEHVATTRGAQRRDFMYVGDVADALVAILRSEIEGAVNVASGTPVTVEEMARLTALAAGGLEHIGFGELRDRGDEPDAIVADTRRLTEEVGFRPAVPLSAGLADTVAWWRNQATGRRSRR